MIGLEWIARIVVGLLGALAGVWAVNEERMNGMGKAVGWGVVIFLVAALVAWLVIVVVSIMIVDAQCTQLGFADSSMAWTFVGYCETRINDTDYVIPLAEAEAWMESTGKELIQDGRKN